VVVILYQPDEQPTVFIFDVHIVIRMKRAPVRFCGCEGNENEANDGSYSLGELSLREKAGRARQFIIGDLALVTAK
jgi:hypothetical protein